MRLLYNFIQDNIDELYRRRTPEQAEAYHATQSRASLLKAQKLSEVPPSRMTAQQRGQLEKEKT